MNIFILSIVIAFLLFPTAQKPMTNN